MTLTIDQVRNCKFHLARRTGYEPADVDNFVDQVEETLVQLTQENDALKQQLAAVGDEAVRDHDSGEEGAGEAQAAPAASDSDDVQAQLTDKDTEIERQRSEIEDLKAQLEQARGQASGEPRVDRIEVSAASDASPAVARLLQLATEQADSLVSEARADADRIVGEANDHKARLESEADANANRVTSDAQRRADELDVEVAGRRDELFGTLENERSSLQQRVDALRAFEASFRDRFAAQLQGHIDNLRNGVIEPADKPELLDGEQPESQSPRLDALLRRENA